ncbi:hypothetical protein A1F94_012004 [Pyrenophora tritici-repentis]|nr:hypothetical protein A1F94_012004 [Pyrenophora tritici-repentis]
MAPRSHTDSFTRAIIVTLKSRFVGKSTSQISEILGISHALSTLSSAEPAFEALSQMDQPKEAIHEPTVDKSLRLRRLSYHGVESPQGSRIQEDEADEEAWVDEEDETR